MRIGVLGTGSVGQTLAGKLSELGHEVTVGTRDPSASRERGAEDPFVNWLAQNPSVGLGTFAETAAGTEMVVNATAGIASLEALSQAGADNLAGKVLLDVSNPLDFSQGMPPRLTVCNTSSLGEEIQAAFPEARVVKSLNTVNASVMVAPEMLPGDHVMFMSGNDAEAKEEVRTLLTEGFGWRNVIDLGDITGARGQEMYLPLWVRLMGTMGHAQFNISIAE